jgi:SAM-dependent methyltransferase
MVAEKNRFHNIGLSWTERAAFGGLQAVVSLGDDGRPALYLHGIHKFCAARALRYLPAEQCIIDFGCGNGRFSRYFSSKGRHVLGTEITWEMVRDAKTQPATGRCEFMITDGICIPVKDASVAGIWCCGVLRYSLLVPNPCYSEIAREMLRVLRPGAYICNIEAYVDNPPELFTAGFEEAGFQTQQVRVLNRYNQFFMKWFVKNPYIPRRWLSPAGAAVGRWHSIFDNPNRSIGGLRDYLFVWQKPLLSKLVKMDGVPGSGLDSVRQQS